MIVIDCQSGPNRTEKAMVAALAGCQGVLLTNFKATDGRRVREVDGVAITPRGVISIEAKHTAQVGELVAAINGPWTVDGASAEFAGGPQPGGQARQQALMVKATLVAGGLPQLLVSSVVAVAGHVTCSPRLYGGAGEAVTQMAELPEALDLVASVRPLSLDDATAVLAALGVMRDDELFALDMALEWAGAETPAATPASPPPAAQTIEASSSKWLDRADQMQESWERRIDDEAATEAAELGEALDAHDLAAQATSNRLRESRTALRKAVGARTVAALLAMLVVADKPATLLIGAAVVGCGVRATKIRRPHGRGALGPDVAPWGVRILSLIATTGVIAETGSALGLVVGFGPGRFLASGAAAVGLAALHLVGRPALTTRAPTAPPAPFEQSARLTPSLIAELDARGATSLPAFERGRREVAASRADQLARARELVVSARQARARLAAKSLLGAHEDTATWGTVGSWPDAAWYDALPGGPNLEAALMTFLHDEPNPALVDPKRRLPAGPHPICVIVEDRGAELAVVFIHGRFARLARRCGGCGDELLSATWIRDRADLHRAFRGVFQHANPDGACGDGLRRALHDPLWDRLLKAPKPGSPA